MGKVPDLSETSRLQKAFNAGCQARIDGRPVESCPDFNGDGHSRTYWKWGWGDVDLHWGEDAKVIPAARIATVPNG